MSSFLSLLCDPFLQRALLTGLLVSLACGIVGSMVVVRRLTFITGGIAHTVLGGVGVALFFDFSPLFGVFISGQLAALLIGFVSQFAKQYEGPIIAALWSVGMALGILLASLSPGYQGDLMSYLFGNILLISKIDVLTVLFLDILILGTVAVFYNALRIICFDEEYAAIRGVHVHLFYQLLLALIALTVVGVLRVVGIIMVLAMMSLPQTMMLRHTRNLAKMMIGSSIICAVLVTSGLLVSFALDWPSGATIVLLTGLAFLVKISLDFLRPSRLPSRKQGRTV